MKSIKMLMMAALTILSLSVAAQKSNTSKLTGKTISAHAVYSCPMHPQITSDKPGKCSICGMTLNLSSKEKMKYSNMKLYTCPMHPEVKSEKPGKCPKCGMDLEKKKK